MTEIQELLDRQARWQKGRKAMTWSEKIRMAEQVRESVRQLRGRPVESRNGKKRMKSARAARPVRST